MFDKKILALCADDFGLSEGVDQAVVELAGEGRLSATSCMVAGSSFARNVAELAAFRGVVDVGLHLTLTDLKPLGPMPHLASAGHLPQIGTTLSAALTRRLDYSEIKAEIGRQIDRFTEVFGHLPDYVDGHQHVHVLPVVRRALLDLLSHRGLQGAMWLRSCEETVKAILSRRIEPAKTVFVSRLSSGMARDAASRGFRTNDSFRGITGFRPVPPFPHAFRMFLQGPGRHPLIMCHPAVPGGPSDPSDTIVAARVREYEYLRSDEFTEDLDRAGVTIGRLFPDLRPASRRQPNAPAGD